jgi:beta-galactosidase beta subunit
LAWYSIQTVETSVARYQELKDDTIVPASAFESTVELDAGEASIFMFPTSKK